MTLERKQKFLNERYSGRLIQVRKFICLIIKFRFPREDLIEVYLLKEEKIRIKRWGQGAVALVKWINENSNELQNKTNKAEKIDNRLT